MPTPISRIAADSLFTPAAPTNNVSKSFGAHLAEFINPLKTTAQQAEQQTLQAIGGQGNDIVAMVTSLDQLGLMVKVVKAAHKEAMQVIKETMQTPL